MKGSGLAAKMNQNDRRTLRKQAADEIQSGKTVSQVAKKYGRTIKWVRDACLENEVEIPRKPRETIKDIVKKNNEGKKVSQISKEIGVSRQYIYSVLKEIRP